MSCTGRFIHPGAVIDYAYKLVREYDKFKADDDRRTGFKPGNLGNHQNKRKPPGKWMGKGDKA